MNLTNLNLKPGDLTPIAPNVNVGENIEVIPLPKIIGLNITQNGASEFHFNTVEDINITSLDVKAISKIYAINNDEIILTETWEELNNYTFSVSEIKKKWVDKIGKWQHTTVIKMIDSPYVSCNLDFNPIYLRFYIYYTLNGENKRFVADTEYPEEHTNKGEHIKYTSNTYKNRAFWPYSLQLDSIYRPFFFNSALLFFDGSLTSSTNTSSNTYAKFYFSIANGCTLRDDTPFRDYNGAHISAPMYRIGDINLKISNLNKQGIKEINSIYNFTIKDNFRIFSEIEDFHVKDNERFTVIETRKNLLKDAHIMGIRESGSIDAFDSDSCISSAENGSIDATGITHHCGILLPNMGNYSYIVPFHNYDKELTPNKISYYDKKIVDGGKERFKFDVYNIASAATFNTDLPLNISFSVNDVSFNNEEYKTIEVNCVDIRFPEINKSENKITIPYTSYTDDITFINLGEDPSAFFNVLGKLNVSDNDNVETNILTYLYNKHYVEKNTLIKLNVDITTNTMISEITFKVGSYILAVYHGGYVNVDNVDEDVEKNVELLKYIKHTNKLIIMKLYKI